MSTVVTLGRADEIEPGTAKRFDVEGHRIAIVRIDDDFYAIGDTCSHANYSLSEGEVDCEERTIECWKHGSLFDLKSGEALTLPATRPVPTYDVVVDDGELRVVIS
ncbi:MAG TPA: non-heme iron oxygenase ferredoxin subunit [Acidimicrobiales bacterium]